MALPQGYKQLEYIVSQYETFLRLNSTFGNGGTTDVYIDCVTTGNSAFWGGSDTTYTDRGYYAGSKTSGSNIIYYSDDDEGTISNAWGNNARHTYYWKILPEPIVIIKDDDKITIWAEVYVDDVLVRQIVDDAPYGNLYVLYGKFPTSAVKTYFYGNVYEVRVAGHKFTPVLRTSDNTAGFYCDTGEFYPSGGDAPFIAGPEANISNAFLGSNTVKKIYYKGKDLFEIGRVIVLEPFKYDYVLDGNYDEVDLIYTADTHASWKGSGRGTYDAASPQLYTWSDISNYKDKLEDAGIPTFAVDSGDFTVGGSTSSSDVNNYNVSINQFNGGLGTKGYTGYIAATFGNHEWKFGSSSSTVSYLSRIKNFTACNFMLSNGSFMNYNKPYKTLKVGGHAIGIIGVGYPSPNGSGSYSNGIWTYEGYMFYDSTNSKSDQANRKAFNAPLYKQVQKYVDLLRSKGIEYIVVVTHMDNNRDEDFSADTRFKARAEYLLMNTRGVDIVIPGHRNYPTDVLMTTDLDGKACFVAPEAGSGLGSFGRIGFDFKNKKINYKLLKTANDLNNINW